MKRKLFWTLGICVILATPGCFWHLHGRRGHPHGMPPGQAKKVLHVHGPGCGHLYTAGRWILVGKHHPGKRYGKKHHPGKRYGKKHHVKMKAK